ncbi:MAG: sulfate respiration complex protein HmcE [Desulfovibrionaceae bacterium]
MYDILTGPLLWISAAICVIGLGYRVFWYINGLSWQLDRVAYSAHFGRGMKGALLSIAAWLVPFGSRNWRVKPGFMVLFFGFHAGLVCVPLFLQGHAVMLGQGLGIHWPAMPMWLADWLTGIMLFSACCIIARRILLPEVRIITDIKDWLVLAITIAPFLTGFVAAHTEGETARTWLMAHIATGELMLVAIPFTKLYHVVGFFLSRGQLGMDFGIKRGGSKKNFAW